MKEERLCSFPRLILNPVLSGSPHMANYFLTVSGTVSCLDLIHCFPSKSENYFNYQLLLMKSWERGARDMVYYFVGKTGHTHDKRS